MKCFYCSHEKIDLFQLNIAESEIFNYKQKNLFFIAKIVDSKFRSNLLHFSFNFL